MKRIFLSVGATLAFSLVLNTNSLNAQSCTEDLSDALDYCVEQGIESCAGAIKECSSKDYVITLDDVWTDAIKNCCGKSSKKKRRACLTLYRRNLGGRRTAALQPFIRAAQNKINLLRKNDCYAGEYQNLF